MGARVVIAAVCVIASLATPVDAQVTCTWTDNPIRAGQTPIKAEHINEIRACIDRILGGGVTPPPPPPPPPGTDFRVQNVRQYDASIDSAHWLYFDVVANIAISRLELGIRFNHQGGTFVSCTETLYDLEAGELNEALVIPDHCGADTPWVSVGITPPAEYSCEGCGTYQASSSAFTTAVFPHAAGDPQEAQRVIAEFSQRVQNPR